MMLTHERVLAFALVESLNGDDAGLKNLGIYHLVDIGLYTVTTENLPILIRAARNLVKNKPNKRASFNAPTIYINAKTFLGGGSEGFVSHSSYRLCFGALEIVVFLNSLISRTHTKSISMWQMFSNCMRLYRYDPTDRKRAWNSLYESSRRRIIQNLQKLFSDSDPTQPEVLLVGKATDPIPRATGKHTKTFLREKVEEKDITVVPELLTERSGKEQVLVQRSAATRRANNLKQVVREKNEEENWPIVRNVLMIKNPPCSLVSARSKGR